TPPVPTLRPYTTLFRSRNAQLNEMAGAPTLPSTNGPQQLMVLATQAEQVHIPESDYIRVIRPRKVSEGSRMDTALIYPSAMPLRSEEHTSELQSRFDIV